MIKRFFKLLYVLALIAIVLSLPVYVLGNIQFDEIVIATYKARCLSNNQYVVLQGSAPGQAWEFNEFESNSAYLPDQQETLNFYCRYFDEIQPHILAYNLAKTPDEQIEANKRYFEFEESVPPVSSYPALYKLEEVSRTKYLNEIYDPLIIWFIGAIIAFLALQIIRVCFVYVVYGKLVWHPFRKIGED